MTISALIRKRDTVSLATAIPAISAISATQPEVGTATVARIARVAVAKSPQEKTAHPAKVGAEAEPPIRAGRWLLHYADRSPMQVVCWPDATHAEMLAGDKDAIAAEPFTPTIRQPSAPMIASEEKAIWAWLELIEETDPATIADVIERCRRDADARAYFTGRAAADLPVNVRTQARIEVAPQSRVTGCMTCRHRKRPGRADPGYCGGERDDLPGAYGVNHPLRKLPDDHGANCQIYSGYED